jgi:hypothetical protein
MLSVAAFTGLTMAAAGAFSALDIVAPDSATSLGSSVLVFGAAFASFG